MQGLTPGRMVHYVLTAEDAEAITRRRADVEHSPNWPVGAQAHVGNPVREGEHVPMIVVAVWDHGENSTGNCNGQVILDGNDSYWATSRLFDESGKPGTWHWIEQA